MPRSEISKGEILVDLDRVAKEQDLEKMSMSDYNEYGKYDAEHVRYRFGGWTDALKAAGIDYYNFGEQPPTIKKEEVLEDIKRVAEEQNLSKISSNDYEEHGEYSRGTAYRFFGSWTNAVEEAGLDSYSKCTYVPKEDILEDIKRVIKNQNNSDIDRYDYDEYGQYSSATAEKRFCSWNNALCKAIKEIENE